MRSSSIVTLALGLCLAPALAQEPQPSDAKPREISHAEEGTTSTLKATPEGEQWKIEMTRHSEREGAQSDQRVHVVVPRDAGTDERLDALFAKRPADPREWERTIEELSGVEIDMGGNEAVEELEELPERVRERMRRARERFERALQSGYERAREYDPWADEDRGPGVDRLLLADGDVLSGELVSLDESGFKFKTAYGELTIARDKVRRIDLKRAPRATLGVTLGDADRGARIQEVRAGSAAEKAGLKPGDLIREVEGQPVRAAEDVRRALAGKKVGEALGLSVERGAETIEVEAKLDRH